MSCAFCSHIRITSLHRTITIWYYRQKTTPDALSRALGGSGGRPPAPPPGLSPSRRRRAAAGASRRKPVRLARTAAAGPPFLFLLAGGRGRAASENPAVRWAAAAPAGPDLVPPRLDPAAAVVDLRRRHLFRRGCATSGRRVEAKSRPWEVVLQGGGAGGGACCSAARGPGGCSPVVPSVAATRPRAAGARGHDDDGALWGRDGAACSCRGHRTRRNLIKSMEDYCLALFNHVADLSV
jgi:hypothetical protein